MASSSEPFIAKKLVPERRIQNHGFSVVDFLTCAGPTSAYQRRPGYLSANASFGPANTGAALCPRRQKKRKTACGWDQRREDQGLGQGRLTPAGIRGNALDGDKNTSPSDRPFLLLFRPSHIRGLRRAGIIAITHGSCTSHRLVTGAGFRMYGRGQPKAWSPATYLQGTEGSLGVMARTHGKAQQHQGGNYSQRERVQREA